MIVVKVIDLLANIIILCEIAKCIAKIFAKSFVVVFAGLYNCWDKLMSSIRSYGSFRKVTFSSANTGIVTSCILCGC